MHITQQELEDMPSSNICHQLFSAVSTMQVVLGLVLVWSAFPVEGGPMPCPNNCVCVANLNVTCNLTKHDDYAALLALDPRTEALTCIVNKTFNESEANFGHLNNLQTLVLKPSKKYANIYEAKRDGARTQFQRRTLFRNLTGLSYLGINLVTIHFDPVLLQNVPNIKTLDLSHSLMEPDTSVQILMWVNQNNFSIQTLLMVGTQMRDPVHPSRYIYTRDDIYRNVNNLPLNILDLSDNVAVVLQVGLTEYLPQLEIFRAGGSDLLTYDFFHHHRLEYLYYNVLDLMMHPSIRECKLRFPNKNIPFYSNAEPDIYSMLAPSGEDYNHTVTTREVANTSFSQLLTRTSELVENGIDSPESECVYGRQFSLPKHLERFIFVNDHGLIASRFFKQSSLLCLHPSNTVLYCDVSQCDMHLVLPDKSGIRGLKKLLYLNLQGTLVTFKTTMSFFTDMESLEVLLLGGNTIPMDRPEDLDFLRIKTLRTLDIQGCGIKHMPQHTLMNLNNLQFLNVSENSLEEFNVNLTGLRDLKFLNLSGNSLRFLDKKVTLSLEGIASRHNLTVDLSHNPLECSCSNQHFVWWLQTSRATFVRKELTLCSNPWSSPRTPWAVDQKQLYRICIHFQTIVSSVVSGLGVSLVIGVIYVVYRRRWTIRYWIHVAREGLRKKRADEERTPLLNDPYKYDAFVAYSSNGEERRWVHITLREKLEMEHNLKLCMYHRDFRAARDLADTIVEGINSSRNTLIILSPTFLESGWCDFEVRMANEKVIRERRDSLIIVIFSKLDRPHTRLPKALAKLLENKIYLEWTEDPDGQRLFWRRLVEAIERDLSYNSFEDAANAQN